MRCSSLLPLCLLALTILAASSTSEMGDEDQVIRPDGPSIAEIGQAPAESKTVPDAQSISRMMDLTGISALHDRNITGKGITIALLDSQFYYDNETAEKLTVDIVPIYNGSYRKYEVHGIACAELISEIAPGVKLYLVDAGGTETDVKNAIEKLMTLDEHIDIVSCSSDFPFGRFDGEDELCKEVEKMTSNGTLWINAAGNQALCHWSGEFKDPDGNGFNNFSPEDESINMTLEKGKAVGIWLSWEDDWDRATMDYDLRLDHPSRGYSISDETQKGYRGQKPIEAIHLLAPEDGTYQIKIRRYDAPEAPVRFHLFTTQNLDEHQVQNSSIGVLGCCRNVITVGAINLSTLDVQPYSSRGPTKDGRRKPDLVAPDNVTTFSYISDAFVGTSASAPYVAGCAALIMEIFGDDPDLDVREVLTESATDLGPPGPDNIYGYGLVNLSNLEVDR
jgi:subtilisin family serine protease